MAGFAIPDKARKGMLYLLSLDDNSINLIVDTLEGVPASASTRRLTTAVGTGLDALSEEQIFEALKTLRSLYGLRSSDDGPIDDFLDNLVLALKDIASQRVSETSVETIKDRFRRLLGVEDVQTFAKIQNLRRSEERSFCKARFLTELKPVFLGGDEEAKGFLVNHRLELGFHQAGGKHQVFYVSLDEEDISELKKAIEAAEKKATALQSQLERLSN